MCEVFWVLSVRRRGGLEGCVFEKKNLVRSDLEYSLMLVGD